MSIETFQTVVHSGQTCIRLHGESLREGGDEDDDDDEEEEGEEEGEVEDDGEVENEDRGGTSQIIQSYSSHPSQPSQPIL